MNTMKCTNCEMKLITINFPEGHKPGDGDITACSFCDQPYRHDGKEWIPFTVGSYERATIEVRDQIKKVWEDIVKFKQGMRDKGLIY
jgi:hypothetical protein